MIYFIRHGESEANVDFHIRSAKANHKISLTEKGRDQAYECSKKLTKMLNPYDRLQVFVSPFKRAIETKEIIMGNLPSGLSPIEIVEDIRLREIDTGNFIDFSKNYLKERQKYGKFYYRFENGESCADVYVRVKQFINEYRDVLLGDKETLIISHNCTIQVFLMILNRLSVEQFENMPKLKNCEIVTWTHQ